MSDLQQDPRPSGQPVERAHLWLGTYPADGRTERGRRDAPRGGADAIGIGLVLRGGTRRDTHPARPGHCRRRVLVPPAPLVGGAWPRHFAVVDGLPDAGAGLGAAPTARVVVAAQESGLRAAGPATLTTGRPMDRPTMDPGRVMAVADG